MYRSQLHLPVRTRLLVPTLSLLFALLVFGPSWAMARQASPAAAVRYTVVDLGTLGGANSFGYCLNANGDVVGDSEFVVPTVGTPATGSTATLPPRHAFLWRDGTMTDLGTLGGPTSRTTAINDADHVAGAADTADGKLHAFLWKDGAMQDLGTLQGGDQSLAISINNHDQIAGLSTTAPGQELGDPGTHAFLWDNGTMTDLGTFGGEFARANGLNDASQVVGGAETADGATHPFIWQNGMMTDLGVLPGFKSGRAIRISNEGVVVGFMLDPIGTPTPGPAGFRGFVYRDGKLIDIGTLGGPSSVADGVNAAGQVVGVSAYAQGTNGAPDPSHGFLWENGVLTDLNDLLVSGSGWEIVNSLLINDTGQIAGVGMANGVTHAVLLTPAG
jgi:probable HAF family extracellular repeat protein